MASLTQPDEFFPWLARLVGAGGPFECERVTPDETGALTFELGRSPRRVLVTWTIGAHAAARRDGQRPFRDGSIGATGDEGLEPRDRELAVGQVVSRLETLLRRRMPALLDRRNRELREVRLGPSTIEALCGALLRPGTTRCGPYLLDRVTFERERLQLAFAGPGVPLQLVLQPREAPAQGSAVGVYGPLRLDAGAELDGSDGARAVARYVGYVLALSTHDGMALEPRSAGDEVAERRTPLGDKANPFLYDDISCGTIVMTAVFASKGRVAQVLHADRECAGFASYLTGLTETVYLPQRGMRPSFDYLRRMRIVDTTELDAIMSGCQSRLTSLVRQSIDEHDPELLIVIGTCVSRVIGDDVAAAVADAGVEERGVPTVWLETTATERDQHHRILWARLVELFQRPRPRADSAPSVNLLGYGYWRTPGMAELTRLLEGVGVRRNAALVPSFEIEELRRFGAADVNLVFPSVNVRDALLWAAPKLAAPALEAPAPFGLRGTRAWLDAVLAFFGREPVDDAWVDARLAPFAERWETLRAAAAAERVALVLTSDHFGSVDPLARHGLRWFDVLQELGFALDVFVIPAPNRAPDPEASASTAAATGRVLDGRPSHRVAEVASPAELQEALAASGATLLYTEIPQDRRATSAGMTPINFLDFRMGFEGACWTLEHLLHLARAPFFRRYRRHLQPSRGTA